MSDEKIVTDVTCSFCGSLCDDIEVVVKDNDIIETHNACALGNQKIMAQVGHRLKTPLIRKKGALEPCSIDEAIEEALRKAEMAAKDITWIVATGYGAANVAEANEVISDISCPCRGAVYLFPSVRTESILAGNIAVF